MHVKSFLDRFCESTAIHGFAHIQRQKHILNKMLWLAILFSVLSLLSFHLMLLVKEYLHYGYNEKAEFSEDHIFPDVLVCPLSQALNGKLFNKTSDAANKEYWDLVQIDELENFTGSYLSDFLKSDTVKFVNLNHNQLETIEQNVGDVVIYAYFNKKQIEHQIKYIVIPIRYQCFLLTFITKARMYYEHQLHLIFFIVGKALKTIIMINLLK